MPRHQERPQSELDAPTFNPELIYSNDGANRAARRKLMRASRGRIRIPVTNVPYRKPAPEALGADIGTTMHRLLEEHGGSHGGSLPSD